MSGKLDHIVTASRAYYEKALAEFGEGPRAVNWRDVETQRLRFAILAGVGNLDGVRVHDVGCGLAHLRDYLTDAGVSARYVGSDISDKMIAAAAKRTDGAAELHCADLLNEDADWMRADYVINSGLFTVRGATPEAEWWDFVRTMIRRMYALADRGIAFNMMTSYVDYRDDHLFYLHPATVMDFCVAELGRRITVRQDYPLWEYTVYVYK